MQTVQQNRKFKLRVHYKKVGRAAWLSQLELARALEHAVRRSGLKYAVSEGFSPHMRISFAQALSVGIECADNVFDILLTEYIAPNKCLNALRKASQECLEPISCAYVDNKAPFELSQLSAYSVEINREVSVVKIPKEITVVKKRKEKTFEVSHYLDGDVETQNKNGNCILDFRLRNYEEGSLNPDLFIRELISFNG